MNRPLVLVVAENATDRHIMAAFLEESFFVVAQAATAEDALGIVERDRPEVVILDLLLPRSGATDLARQIKSRDPDLPIVAISANPNGLPSLAEGNFAAALAKPFDREELVDLVQGLCPEHLPTPPTPLDEPTSLSSEDQIARQGSIPRVDGESRPMANGSVGR